MSTMTKRYSTSELAAMPTLTQGQMDDLKVDTGTERVWLSRMTLEDGAPYAHTVGVERLIDGSWVLVEEYDGDVVSNNES